MNRALPLLFHVGLAAALVAASACGVIASEPMNLLIIHTDEHNFRTLGCYREQLPKSQALMWGDAVVETPNIDWIAHHGAICMSFYATTPLCSPSRSSFLTGCYPQNTPVVTNNIPMKKGLITFAEVLRRKGYKTGYAGKWHLAGSGKPQWAPRPSFGFEDNKYMYNRGHWKQLKDTPQGPRVAAVKRGKPTYSVAGATEKSFTTDFLADKTVAFIGAHRSGPFCFMLSIPDPHGPDTVRPPYDTMFADQTFQKPISFDVPAAGLPSWGQKTQCGYNQSKYYGMVKCIDDNVGKILDSLRKEKLLERTVVIFTSDHGDLRGEHSRQNKGVPYEGSARIPFVIYCPGKIRPGTVVHEAMATVDFKSTILDLMGFPSVPPDEGRDCARLLIDGKAPAGWQDVVFLRSAQNPNRQWVAVVSDRYKLILSPFDPPWLFDLEKDPNELANVFSNSEYRTVVRNLAAALKQYGTTHADPRVALPTIQYDLKWCLDGTSPYSWEGRPKPQTQPARRTRKRGKGA